MTMGDVFAVSQVTKAVWAVVGMLLIFGVLRLRDYYLKLNLEKVIDGIEKDPLASAVYLGVTFFGACYLVGQLLS